MEATVQHDNELHAKVGQSLQQLGHEGTTVPPQEAPVLSDEVKQFGEDLTHGAKTALEELITGGVTHVRTTESRRPNLIARMRESLKKNGSNTNR